MCQCDFSDPGQANALHNSFNRDGYVVVPSFFSKDVLGPHITLVSDNLNLLICNVNNLMSDVKKSKLISRFFNCSNKFINLENSSYNSRKDFKKYNEVNFIFEQNPPAIKSITLFFFIKND